MNAHTRFEPGTMKAPVYTVSYRPALSLDGARVRHLEHGPTLGEIIATTPDLPADFSRRGVVCINGEPIGALVNGEWEYCGPNAFAVWCRTRPRPGTQDRPVFVTLHRAPRGGGGQGGGGKQIIALVAAIALTIATAGIGAGALGVGGSLLGAAGFSFLGAGSIGASILAAGVGLAGALAISALTAAPVQQNPQSAAEEQRGAASASGNVLEKAAAIPRVVGTFRVFPPLPGEPIVELVGNDEFVEAAFILAGPHHLTGIRVSDTSVEDAADIDYETREGWDDDAPITLCQRQGRTSNLNIRMSVHNVDSTNQAKVKWPYDSNIPVPHDGATSLDWDELWIHFLLPGGLASTADTTNDKSLPIRIQIRERLSPTWKNMVELHLSDRTTNEIRREVRLKRGTPPETVPAVPTRSGWVAAYKHVGTSVPWDAPLFSKGSGGDGLYQGVEGSSNVKNVFIYDSRVEIYLDEVDFPRGAEYEVRILRGAVFDSSVFNKANYQHNGTLRDLFTYQGGGRGDGGLLPISRENISDTVYIKRIVSVWNEPLLPLPGNAVIAIRARNRDVSGVSVEASGWVRDWDGTGWRTWVYGSDYIAAHYNDVLRGRLTAEAMPDGIIDNAGLLNWRQRCLDDGLTCDAIFEGQSLQEALATIASCGYAKPYHSDVWGVAQDRPRTSDDVVQLLSPRNTWNVRFEKAYPRLPDGFRISFADATRNYDQNEVIVYRRGYGGGDAGRFEAVTYKGLVHLADVQERGAFDLDQAELRGTFYYMDCPPLALLCRRGDMVALQHDILHVQSGFARIKEKIFNGSNQITGFVLDAKIPVVTEDSWWTMSNFWNNA